MPGTASAATLNIPLLNRLRAAGGEYVPLDELARARTAPTDGGPEGASSSGVSGTGISAAGSSEAGWQPVPPADRERLRADLDSLASFGFAIERHPYRGAAYIGPADRLCPDQIEFELRTARIGRRIAVWGRVPSTNDLASRAVRSVSNEGLVILAEEQTAGRGRRGRSWTAPPRSSILMSVLLLPPPELSLAGPEAAEDCAWLTAMGAVATAEVVAAWTGREAAIKWPNDVRVDGRKIAGVLVERPGMSGADPPAAAGAAAVIGIGLNVNLARDALLADLQDRATSIQIERGGPVDRSEIARDLIRRLDHWYEAMWSLGCATLNAPWRDRNELLGRVVQVSTPAGPHTGRLVDLDLRLGLTLAIEGRGGRGPDGPHPAGSHADPHRVRLHLAEVQAVDPVQPSSR